MTSQFHAVFPPENQREFGSLHKLKYSNGEEVIAMWRKHSWQLPDFLHTGRFADLRHAFHMQGFTYIAPVSSIGE